MTDDKDILQALYAACIQYQASREQYTPTTSTEGQEV